MATTTCSNPACQKQQFEVADILPFGHGGLRMRVLQCANCGTVVSALEWESVIARLDRQDKALLQIAEKLGVSVKL